MREIQLTQGKVALIDDADYERVIAFAWYAAKSVTKNFVQWYAQTKINGKTAYLHRFLMGAGPGAQVDHRDHDGLNNVRGNLRICGQAQNNANARFPRAASGFRGVYLNKTRGHHFAAINIGGVMRFLGRFDRPEDAARRYDEAAQEAYGEFATLNFREAA